MCVVDAWVEAGGTLVAPDGCGLVREDVGEGTVEELEQLIPFCGVVEPRVVAAEPNGIMDDMLQRERGGESEREAERVRERQRESVKERA